MFTDMQSIVSNNQMPHGYFYYNGLTFNGTAAQVVIYALHENSSANANRNPAAGTVLINNDDLIVTKTSTAYIFQAQFKRPCRVYIYDTGVETTYATSSTLNLEYTTSYKIMFDV